MTSKAELLQQIDELVEANERLQKELTAMVIALHAGSDEIERLTAENERLENRNFHLEEIEKIWQQERTKIQSRVAALEKVVEAAKALTLTSWNDMAAIDDALEVLIEALAALQEHDDG